MKFKRYETRFQAGEILAHLVKIKNEKLYDVLEKDPSDFFCFAIPNGGVPIAEGFCKALEIKYDILIVRKIKIPWNTEAGFGSITTDGSVLINEPLYNRLNLNDAQLNKSIELTKQEIQERLSFYNKKTDLTSKYEEFIEGKYIFMLDDGLASGFTMIAAIQMVKKYNPKKIFIAVPTAPLGTVKRVKDDVDGILCPNVRDVMWFAVADAYKNWYDVPETEVIEILKDSKYYFK